MGGNQQIVPGQESTSSEFRARLVLGNALVVILRADSRIVGKLEVGQKRGSERLEREWPVNYLAEWGACEDLAR
jgi:hypothetical protein